MKRFAIQKLAQIIKAERLRHPEGLITGVSIDSRAVRPGDCFFAIKGENFDGHDYVAEAFSKGAACAVVSKDVTCRDGLVLQAPDTIKALGRFAAEYRREQDFKVIAITGSVGKTTTRQMIFQVLKQHFNCHQSPKSFNTDIGLPLTLLGAEPDHEIVIAELGSNYPGEIKYLSQIAQPDLALITNVSLAHLLGFGNIQSITGEKVSIAKGLSVGGSLIINGNIRELVECCQSKKLKFLTFGKSAGCDISAANISTDGLCGRFKIEGTEVLVPVPGVGNIENALAAWAVCREFGVCAGDFAKALRSLPAVPMRMEVTKIGRLTVINDCYNANPASMKNALECLALLGSSQNRRLVFICGPMLELGEQSEELHAELGRAIAQAGVRLLLAVGPFAGITADAAGRASKNSPKTACFADTARLCDNLEKFLESDDIILVKGSRAYKLEAVVERLKELFG